MAENKSIPADLPIPVGVDVIDRLARYSRSDFTADYAIGNQPWLSAASDQNRISRITTQYQKERVDQALQAGENSLSNWWLRSATSWHRGAGSTFYDADTTDQFRFRESANVNVWDQGTVSLLKDTEEIQSSGATVLETCSSGFWFVRSNQLWIYKTATSTASQVTGITAAVYAVTTDGSSALVAAADGVYSVLESSLAATKLYSAPGGAWVPQQIGFVKDRIIVCAQITDALPMRVFELGRNPSSPPVAVNTSTSTGDSRWEYSSTSLTFNAVTETTGAILVAVTTGNRSRVISFYVDTTTSGLAALQEPITVAELPSGETINELRGYLSTYVIAATTKGLRVAEETTNGRGFTYGPITVDGDIKDFSFNGEYIYCTRSDEFLGAKGLWRVHLGTAVGDVYAYASDLSVAAGTPQACTVLGTTGRMVIATESKIYVEHASRLASSGYVDSGWVRFGTTEYKQPVSFSVRTRGSAGSIGVRVSDQQGNDTTFESIPLGKVLNIPLSASLLPETEFEIRVVINRDSTDDTAAPFVDEWQLRSLPAPLRSRTITIPMLCFQQEKDVNGNIRTSNPFERLRALEALEQSGGACLFQDFATGEERICVVRAVQYEQSSPPTFVNGFGGVVTVQLQTVDVEVV